MEREEGRRSEGQGGRVEAQWRREGEEGGEDRDNGVMDEQEVMLMENCTKYTQLPFTPTHNTHTHTAHPHTTPHTTPTLLN